MLKTSVRVVPALLAAVGVSAAVAGPVVICPSWDRDIGQPGAVGGSVQVVRTIGDTLYVGGGFNSIEGLNQPNWGRIDLNTGVPMGFGNSAPDNFVTDFFEFDDGTGTQLYITGSFNSVSVNGMPLPNSKGLVRWDGNTINTVPNTPLTGIFDFMFDGLVYNGRLVVGGSGGTAQAQKPTLAFWDGVTWTKLSQEFSGLVAPVILTMAEFNGDLYIGGRFATFDADLNDPNNPVVSSNNIIRYNADTDLFTSVDGGVFRFGSNVSQVLAMKVFDDGSGEKLYVGGRFDRLGSMAGEVSPAVARWTGSEWEAMPGFPQSGREVRSLEVFDGELYAVGNFETTGDGTVTCRKFAKWTGSEWVEVGDGILGGVANDNPGTIAPVDDGLIIGGSFLSVGNGTGPGAGAANGLAKWFAACAADCPGDTNGDNTVNFADLNNVLSTFGQTGPGLAGDVNGDDIVNFDDLNTVLTNFGTECN
ncbi:MAG: hypothetical protein ACTS27_06215 [Phycisphaerales bacterium]